MRPMSVEEYEALTRHDRESWGANDDLVTRPLFPMTEQEATRLLADCGLKGVGRWLERYREKGEITATKDAWGRAAVTDAWKRLVDLGAVKADVHACHAFDITYRDFMEAYLAACGRVMGEFGDVAPVAGVFGRHELVAPECFVKVFYPVRGVARGRVEFRLADDTRAEFTAAKTK